MNIPNIISLFRILLIPIFIYAYFTIPTDYYYIVPIILLVSGVTDLLDGYIARKYNLVTQIGKILDPIADKLTQISICICLSIKYNSLAFLLVIFLIKEILMILGGFILIKKNVKIRSSKWYGKLSTFIFYVATFLIIVPYNISDFEIFIYSLVIILFSIFSLIMYILEYSNLGKYKLDSSKEKMNDL